MFTAVRIRWVIVILPATVIGARFLYIEKVRVCLAVGAISLASRIPSLHFEPGARCAIPSFAALRVPAEPLFVLAAILAAAETAILRLSVVQARTARWSGQCCVPGREVGEQASR